MKSIWMVGVVCIATIGCAGRRPSDDERASGPANRGAIVVRGSEMSGNVLDGLRARVPSMTVRSGTGSCPQIILRGVRSVINQGNPSVYVDGALMTDTCILQQILASDVDVVEVYTGGNVSDPSIQRNPFGIIIVRRITR